MTEQIIVWHDKHGSFNFKADTEAQRLESCATIVRERLDRGYFDADDDLFAAIKLVDAYSVGMGNYSNFWAFLTSRNDHEYESVEQVMIR